MYGDIIQWMILNITLVFVLRLILVRKNTSDKDKGVYSLAGAVYLALTYSGFFVKAMSATDMADIVMKYLVCEIVCGLPYAVVGGLAAGTNKINIIGSIMFIIVLTVSVTITFVK